MHNEPDPIRVPLKREKLRKRRIVISHTSHQEFLIESQVTWVAPTFDSTKVGHCATDPKRDFKMGGQGVK
jgi:hypothetical protein